MTTATFDSAIAELIDRHEPEAVVLEESFVGADARIALSVGQARGAALVACASAGVYCTEYPPASVKQAVCGYGRAEKAQVQRMVKAILGLAEPQEMLDSCGERNITADIEMIRMDQINEVCERMLKSDVKYRFVIDTASLRAG